MKRILIFFSVIVIISLFMPVGNALAQDGTPGGFPPPTDLYNDAVLLARFIPFLVAIGFGFGIWQAKINSRRVTAPDSPTITRHDLGTVIAHWSNAIGFMTGMLTGAIVLRWLPRPDEMRGIFQIHYIAAGLALFGLASHLAQNIVSGGAGLLPRSLREVREGIAEIIGYSGIFGTELAVFGIKLPKGLRKPLAEIFVAFGIAPPKRLGKFLPAEKVFSYLPWAIIVSVIVVTGLIKSVRYLFAIPPSFVATMTTLHDLFSIAAIVMLALHLSAVLLVPHNWPLLISMFTTRIKTDFVQAHHPLWYEKLRGGSARQAAAPTARANRGATSSGD
ncbi:MAG: cytochrome b/b6 domain-containing protein [Chloroflexi bacterium]|nr:cytochrome b/b6 domain-containing protein [Chloroflexota bacterium]